MTLCRLLHSVLCSWHVRLFHAAEGMHGRIRWGVSNSVNTLRIAPCSSISAFGDMCIWVASDSAAEMLVPKWHFSSVFEKPALLSGASLAGFEWAGLRIPRRSPSRRPREVSRQFENSLLDPKRTVPKLYRIRVMGETATRNA